MAQRRPQKNKPSTSRSKSKTPKEPLQLPRSRFEKSLPAPPRPSPATKSRSGGVIPKELADKARGVRLQKFLAEAGVASRRDCEALIANGVVTVNREVVSALPAWVNPFRDHVEVNGVPVPRPAKTERAKFEARHRGDDSDSAGPMKSAPFAKTYIVLNKPRKVISTAIDPEGRTSVVDLVDLPAHLAGRLFPVGRLDADSTGLILLTNDGELANQLTHPRFGVPKQYMVTVAGMPSIEDIERLKKGLILAHRQVPGPRKQHRSIPAGTPPPKEVRLKKAALEHVRVLNAQKDISRGDRATLLITLREGQNREIRRLLARLGFKVRKLQRVAIGPLTIKGLASGAWRQLTPREVQDLQKAAKRAKAEQEQGQ